MSKDYEEPISEESSKTTRTVENGAKHLQLSHDLVVVLCNREVVWLSGKGAGFVIWWSRVKSSIQLLTGFVLGFPKFNFTAALCSQLVCLLPVEIFKHFTFVWNICSSLLHITKRLEACNKRYINCKFKFNCFFLQALVVELQVSWTLFAALSLLGGSCWFWTEGYGTGSSRLLFSRGWCRQSGALDCCHFRGCAFCWDSWLVFAVTGNKVTWFQKPVPPETRKSG